MQDMLGRKNATGWVVGESLMHAAMTVSSVQFRKLSFENFVSAEDIIQPISRLGQHRALAESAAVEFRDESAEVVEALLYEVSAFLL